MADENPWPRPGDVLFSDGGHWWNACLGWTNDQWWGFTEGYRLAAELLVKHVGETMARQDVLIYPIVFLYRHALEVSLKHLLFKISRLLRREPPKANRHGLVELWQQCRPMIEEVWPEGPKEDLDAVGDVLTQFEAKDPKSTAFRYPDGGLAHVRHQIDIVNFAEVAERAYALLDASASAVNHYYQELVDAEREHSEYERDEM